MIRGFEWVPQHDRQLQYDNGTYENEYIPIQSSLGYGFEWTKDSDEQQQYLIDLYDIRTLIYFDGAYHTLGTGYTQEMIKDESVTDGSLFRVTLRNKDNIERIEVI